MKIRVPERFATATMESVNQVQFAGVHAYKKGLLTLTSYGTGIMLSGPPGVGKTWSMAALTKYYVEKIGPQFRDHVFITAPTFFAQYSDFADETDDRRDQSWRKTYDQVPWLVLNDLGKEYRGGKLGEQIPYLLGRLLRGRNERKLVTHITTNLSARAEKTPNLQSTYGESIVSLIREGMKVYEVTGPDLRGK